MSRQANNGATPDQPRDPQRDAQFWLGWLAAILVVMIIVAVVVLGWQQLNQTAPSRAEVAMTPIVGGMALVTATPTSSTSRPVGTRTPAAPATQTVAAETSVVVTTTIPAATAEVAAEITATATMTQPLATPVVASATPEPTDTPEPPAEPTVAPTPTATVAPPATERPSPTPTSAPTRTPTPGPAMRVVFAPGDLVASRTGRLTVYAHAATDAPVLDSVGAGVPLTVLEPNGDDTEYPVIADGHGWVRVRAADGLVGWAMTDTLDLQP